MYPLPTYSFCVSTFFFFFFNDTATTEIYPLSLHDALPISSPGTPSRSDSNNRPSPSLRIGFDPASRRRNASATDARRRTETSGGYTPTPHRSGSRGRCPPRAPGPLLSTTQTPPPPPFPPRPRRTHGPPP